MLSAVLVLATGMRIMTVNNQIKADPASAKELKTKPYIFYIVAAFQIIDLIVSILLIANAQYNPVFFLLLTVLNLSVFPLLLKKDSSVGYLGLMIVIILKLVLSIGSLLSFQIPLGLNELLMIFVTIVLVQTLNWERRFRFS